MVLGRVERTPHVGPADEFLPGVDTEQRRDANGAADGRHRWGDEAVNPTDERYFEQIETKLDAAFDRARAAKAEGKDPSGEIEIPVARDMADRVENILGIPGVAERVRELEADYSREEAALALVTDFVEGSVGNYDTRAGKIEGAVRTAVALLTEGVVAAPIEGIDRVELLTNDDGTEFINVYYAGPIRSAGGTAQALSVLVADYARALLGIDQFKPREKEVERYAEEVDLYDTEKGLQYTPKASETKFVAQHMPIMLDGEATSDGEVSGFRDLERVDTNAARGGMCLVLAEGIALKAPKIQRYTSELDEVSWPWLQDLIDGTYADEKTDAEENGDASDDAESDGELESGSKSESGDGSASDDESESGDGSEASDDAGSSDGAESDDNANSGDGAENPATSPRAEPHGKYLRDLIAGRPVFGHPSEPGGFRLRYGRARNHGHATAGVHPATMHLVDDFLATGTQIKTERPGKAAGVVPVDSIEGPTVRLANGEVRRIDDAAEAKEIRNGVESILDLGEYLVNYGEFVENNHPLAPASYTVEWWVQEFEAAGGNVQAARDDPHVDLTEPSVERALSWATEYDCPLHPAYTYLWHDVSVEDAQRLAAAVTTGTVRDSGAANAPETAADGGVATRAAGSGRLVIERTPALRETLESLLVEHTQTDDTLEMSTYRPLCRQLGITDELERTWDPETVPEAARTYDDGDNAIRFVAAVAPFAVRERAPTRVGCRMGRPEKSESRELSPAVHTLFPVGEAGGSQRSVGEAANVRDGAGQGVIDAQLGERRCPNCDTHDYHVACPECGTHTEPHYECDSCGQTCTPDEAGRVECARCDRDVRSPTQFPVDINAELADALAELGERRGSYEMLKGVKGLSSEHKTPEPLAKGVLRAKHGVSAFKDGTVRYDMTDLPVTAVRPEELDVTVGQFRELGYEVDVNGDPLRHPDQLVELNVQDVVLSDGAADHMLQTAAFVDDLLERFYDSEPFYEFDDRDDLVGELVFGMAPHTSAAVVGRVVGFTSAAVGYAHPYFHAAKRRNCFHPDTKLWYTDEAGHTHYDRIEAVVERYLDPETADEDDFGTLVTQLPAEVDLSVPSVADDGTTVSRSVEAVSKHPAPAHQIRIETRSGRSITVTPDHELRVYDTTAGRLTSKKAQAIEQTDHLVTPTDVEPATTDVEPTTDSEPATTDGEPQTVDLLAALLQTDTISTERLVIRGLDDSELQSLLESVVGAAYDPSAPLASAADALGVTEKRLCCNGVPVGVLLGRVESADGLLALVPEDVRLGIEREDTEIARQIELSESVATLLGHYAAAGVSRRSQTDDGTVCRTTVGGGEPAALSETLRDAFGVSPHGRSDTEVTVSNRLLHLFFDEVVNAGTTPTGKRVPQQLFDCSAGVRAAYLRGFFGGHVESDPQAVVATAVSEELREDTVALLTSLGIESSVTRSEPVALSAQFPASHDPERPTTVTSFEIAANAERIADIGGVHHPSEKERLEAGSRRVFDGGSGSYDVDQVATVEIERCEQEYMYDLTVAETHTLVANDLYAKQCDGDEDCVMLLLDGLLNFSKEYLPDQRGGQMDAPLVMSSRIDPAEIDDEAHNVDIVGQYPASFYEATREQADPGAVDITIAEETLGTDDQYRGFDHTHDTTSIHMGPSLSAYKTLGSMTDKMDAQLALSRRLRAVDETDVAERIIEYHFLPDLIGNLRAFSRQETRCLDCGEKYRRMPLTGDCRECGGRVNLTVHQGSVNKYMDTAREVAEEFDCRGYTKQRLEVLDRSLASIFENDKNKPTSIADFM